jgi:hypothetical protein
MCRIGEPVGSNLASESESASRDRPNPTLPGAIVVDSAASLLYGCRKRGIGHEPSGPNVVAELVSGYQPVTVFDQI